MDITEFVSTPKVTTLTIESPEILEKYKGPIDFYVKLPIPIEDYAGLSKLTIANFVQKMLVNKTGEQLLKEGQTLDQFLMQLVHDRIWVEVGKLPEKC